MKRSRTDRDGQSAGCGTSVHPLSVVKLEYANLPPDSRKRLDAYLREWAGWHAEMYLPGYQPPEVFGGSITYQPDLMHLGNDIIAWEDKPTPPDKTPSSTMWFNVAYEKIGDVPAYDRAIDTPLDCPDPKKRRGQRGMPHELSLAALPMSYGEAATAGEEGAAGRPVKRARGPASFNRCFNCGSYAHSMRDCWREHNKELVEQSKKDFADAREAGSGYRSAAKRYFLGGVSEPGGSDDRKKDGGLALEWEDVRPGQLSDSLRSAMGLGPLDPPPWLNRMKAMGVPPGYRIMASRKFKAREAADAMEATTAAATAVAVNVHSSPAAEPPATCSAAPQEASIQAANYKQPGEQRLANRECSESLVRQGSLESGELPESEEEQLGDFLAFDGEPADAPCQEQQQSQQRGVMPNGVAIESAAIDTHGVPAVQTGPEPLEDFIPIGSTSEPSDSEGEDEGGERDWGPSWVYIAQFPGVNAPIPDGSDPAKWSQASAEADLPPGFDSGGCQHAQHVQNMPQRGSSRLRQMHGLHPSRSASSSLPFFNTLPGVGGAVAGDFSSPSQQQQQQQYSLRHMPSSPALLQQTQWEGQQYSLQHAGAVQGVTVSPYSRPPSQQGQQQYSPIVAQQANVLPPLPPQRQQQQPMQQAMFTVAASDPGHILPLAASLPLQLPLPSPLPLQQQYIVQRQPMHNVHQLQQPQSSYSAQPMQQLPPTYSSQPMQTQQAYSSPPIHQEQSTYSAELMQQAAQQQPMYSAQPLQQQFAGQLPTQQFVGGQTVPMEAYDPAFPAGNEGVYQMPGQLPPGFYHQGW